MASEEQKAYLDTALAQLEEAKLAIENRRYSLCALMSACSAESATSALIVQLGSRPSKKHRNSLVLRKLSEAAEAPLKSKISKLIDSMKKLEPHIIMARYPIRKGPELLPPIKFYTSKMAEELFDQASKVMDIVKGSKAI